MLSGMPPFYGDDMDKMFEQIKAGMCLCAVLVCVRCLCVCVPCALFLLLIIPSLHTGRYEFRMPQWKNVPG